MLDMILTLGTPLTIVVMAMVIGTILEKRHFRSIVEREQLLGSIPTLTVKSYPVDQPIASAHMVFGSVVVSIDHFKRLLAGLRNIFGGEVRSYCSLLDRARREAILRMKEQFPQADLIVNVRVETSSISKSTGKGKQQSIGSTEVLVYGTAIKYQA